MLAVPVANAHELVRDACQRVVGGVDQGANRVVLVPVAYVVEHTAHNVPLWATSNPFEAFANRVTFACVQGTTKGFFEAAGHLAADGDAQVVLGTAMGRAAFWKGESGLETMSWEPSIDAAYSDPMHASFLSEMLAVAAGIPLGKTWITTPLLCTAKERLPMAGAVAKLPLNDPYQHFARFDLTEPAGLLEELMMVLQEGPVMGLKHRYTRRVAIPILTAGQFLTSDLPKRFDAARDMLASCESQDWREACCQWIAALQKAARG